MARKKQSTLPTSAGGASTTAAAAPIAPPDLTPDVEGIMNWWRTNAGNFAPAIKKAAMWQTPFDNFKSFFGISPALKKAEPGIVLNNPASQSGTGMAKKVMILPPFDINSPSVSSMATESNWKKVLEVQDAAIAIFLETDSTSTPAKDVVHTILVDENHGLYNSSTMSKTALSAVFPTSSFFYKTIPKRATSKTAIGNLWSLQEFKNIILEGVPGTGKTYEFGELVKKWPTVSSRPAHKRAMTFHPSTSYEDFVVGIRPTKPVSGGPPFAVKPGFIIDVVMEACRNPSEDYLLLLDEFNRANVPKVMGDLITLLESSKRAKFDTSTSMWEAETTLTLPLEFPSPPPAPGSSPVGVTSPPPPSPTGAPLLAEATWNQFFIPDNVYVIGTMNTTDRSVAPLDNALRRRFVFFRVEPMDSKDLEVILSAEYGVPKPLLKQHTSLWRALNLWLAENIGLDAKLGHSYLFEACRVLEKSIRAKSSIELWEMLLLPQLKDILMNNHLDDDEMFDFNREIGAFSLNKKKLVLRTTGKGINEMPVLEFK